MRQLAGSIFEAFTRPHAAGLTHDPASRTQRRTQTGRRYRKQREFKRLRCSFNLVDDPYFLSQPDAGQIPFVFPVGAHCGGLVRAATPERNAMIGR